MDNKLLQEISERLKKIYNPASIYLFGSNSWGIPTVDSDLDICLILNDDPNLEKFYLRSQKGLKALWDIPYPIDLLVYTKKEIEKNATHKSSLIYKILNKGTKLYEAA